MKQTILEMTQDVLSSLSSDAVNSISDTTESMQVATMIKNKFYDIANRGNFPEHTELVQLEPSLSSAAPVLMYVPDNVLKINWLKYFDSNVGFSGYAGGHDINVDLPADEIPWTTTSSSTVGIGLGTKVFTIAEDDLDISTGDYMIAVSGSNMMFGVVSDYTNFTLTVSITNKIGSGTYSSWVIDQNESGQAPPGYQYVTILPPQQFIEHVGTFNPVEDDVQSFTFTDTFPTGTNNFTFYYKNRETPKYCTVISNNYVIFDAYDLTQDVTLQAAKTMVEAKITPTFLMEDDFVPDLEDQQFPLLLNEVKALAFFELKQQVHVKAEQEVKRQWSLSQKNKNISGKPTPFDALPNYGRSRRWI